MSIYTHIIYLDVAPTVVKQRRDQDKQKKRRDLLVDELTDWQETEQTELRKLCLDDEIPFTTVPYQEASRKASSLIRDIRVHSESTIFLSLR